MTTEHTHSVYCLPSDVLDEGAGAVLDNVQNRAGLRSLTVAVKYHAVSDVYPHNPVRKLSTQPAGVFYRPSLARYASAALRPVASPLAGARDVLEEACSAAASRQMSVSAWVVLLHHDEALAEGPGMQTNCFGDQLVRSLCAANPDVCLFAERLVDEIASYPVRTVRMESLHYHGVGHGHHERLLEAYGEAAMFLLGLCFCQWCSKRANDQGIDADQLAASVRLALKKLFDGQLSPATLNADALVDLCRNEILAYQDVRKRTVTSLVGRLAKLARHQGNSLSVIEQTVSLHSYASGSRVRANVPAWEFAQDVRGILASGAKLEVTGYQADPGDLQAVLAWYRPRVKSKRPRGRDGLRHQWEPFMSSAATRPTISSPGERLIVMVHRRKGP